VKQAATMNQDFSIRKATLRDGDEILQCLRQAFAPYRRDYATEAFADTVLTPETLRLRLAEMTILIAASGSGHVMGTIAYKLAESGEAHIRGMAVLPELHGSPVAKALLARAEADLRDLGCRVVTLHTTRPLARAIRFYEKNGFRATGEVSSFFGMDLFAYRKEIGES
jgi:ribosomal protein S18 acetylase RimI-like enzyme